MSKERELSIRGYNRRIDELEATCVEHARTEIDLMDKIKELEAQLECVRAVMQGVYIFTCDDCGADASHLLCDGQIECAECCERILNLTVTEKEEDASE